jgi:hypothetical protein
MKKQGLRVVAIDPTPRGFAFAAFEGRDELIDWGIAYISERTQGNIRERFVEILDRNNPECLVIEESAREQKTNAMMLLKVIVAVAAERELPVIQITRTGVRKALQPARTKNEISKVLARLYPELESRLPRLRKPWQNEDERMDIFDAVSFAFAALSK